MGCRREKGGKGAAEISSPPSITAKLHGSDGTEGSELYLTKAGHKKIRTIKVLRFDQKLKKESVAE